MSDLLSGKADLAHIQHILIQFAKLPFFSDSVPGAVLEGVLATVRNAKRLGTYDFVDVVDVGNQLGWQVKSTKSSTPVTWKRAKIPDSEKLIGASRLDKRGAQDLGDSIIRFCNEHAAKSLRDHHLSKVGYARLTVFPEGAAVYFERELFSVKRPLLFEYSDYAWKWSIQKESRIKEQLPALHGIHVKTGRKHWAWHGLGENQLHFSGESDWWPKEGASNAVWFKLPSAQQRLSLESFLKLLDAKVL